MNSVDMDNEELSDDEDDEDYDPDEEEYDEGPNDEDDYIVRNYDDDEIVQDEEDDYEPVGNDTTDVNDDNNLGCLIGSPGEVMPDENPGVEDNENIGVEQEDHDIVSPEVEDIESTEVEDDNVTENQDSVSIENEKNQTMRNDQDCSENEGVQNESRYNLRRNRAQSYEHVYNPEVYETENSKDSVPGEVMLTTIDDIPEEMPQMSMKKGLKVFSEGGYAAVKKEMQQLHDQKVMQRIS